MLRGVFAALCAALVMTPPVDAGSVRFERWGATPDGEIVQLVTLANDNGLRARIATYGGILVSLEVPDKDGRLGDVLLGFDSLEGYLGEHPYFGALVGRYANRIAAGRFPLLGRTYALAVNNGPNALHGGIRGFDKRVWAAVPFTSDEGAGVALTYVSEDGEEGYPGALTAQVRYTLTENDGLRIDYAARTDQTTVLNLTNHAYFNLKDGGRHPILDHQLRIEADHFTPVDATLIPTGELRLVEGTPFDFRESTAVGERIDADNEQIRFGGGYDHNFALRPSAPGRLARRIRVEEPSSGRVMDVLTTEPGVQFYTGNFLDGSITGKDGVAYQRRSGFCLETQHFPDSPNQPAFPTTVLAPGEVYRSTTIYRFSTR